MVDQVNNNVAAEANINNPDALAGDGKLLREVYRAQTQPGLSGNFVHALLDKVEEVNNDTNIPSEEKTGINSLLLSAARKEILAQSDPKNLTELQQHTARGAYFHEISKALETNFNTHPHLKNDKNIVTEVHKVVNDGLLGAIDSALVDNDLRKAGDPRVGYDKKTLDQFKDKATDAAKVALDQFLSGEVKVVLAAPDIKANVNENKQNLSPARGGE